MNISDIIKEAFMSKSMIDYLCNNIENISNDQLVDIINASTSISLQRKLELLEWLSQFKDIDNNIILSINASLDALYDKNTNIIFILDTYVWNDEFKDSILDSSIPFLNYEKAIEYIKTDCNDEMYKDIRFWYILEKWERDDNGNLIDTWSYVLINDKVIFAYKPQDSQYINIDPNKIGLNLSIPFNSGDIIEVSSMPFNSKKYALIIDIGDNVDCCSVQHVYVEDNLLNINALKHGHIFNEELYASSPLFSIERYNGELNKHDKVLLIIKDYIINHPEIDTCSDLWQALHDISNNMIACIDITEELIDEYVREVLLKKDK